MTKSNVRFCWLCGNKLYGNHKATLLVDGHPRTLHKACNKEIETNKDRWRLKDGEYSSVMWDLKGFTKY